MMSVMWACWQRAPLACAIVTTVLSVACANNAHPPASARAMEPLHVTAPPNVSPAAAAPAPDHERTLAPCRESPTAIWGKVDHYLAVIYRHYLDKKAEGEEGVKWARRIVDGASSCGTPAGDPCANTDEMRLARLLTEGGRIGVGLKYRGDPSAVVALGVELLTTQDEIFGYSAIVGLDDLDALGADCGVIEVWVGAEPTIDDP